MKKNYAQQNVNNIDNTYRVLSFEVNVTMASCVDMFKDFDNVFDEIYKRPGAGAIQKNYISQLRF